MTNPLRGLPKSGQGFSSLECGLIAALVSIAIIASATALGETIEVQFDRVETTISTPTS